MIPAYLLSKLEMFLNENMYYMDYAHKQKHCTQLGLHLHPTHVFPYA